MGQIIDLIRCGECGGGVRMYFAAMSKDGRYRIYRCHYSGAHVYAQPVAKQVKEVKQTKNRPPDNAA